MEASENPQEQPERVDNAPDFAPSWPDDVREACVRFFAFEDEDIRGGRRLGALEFSDAPQRVEQIRGIVRDLALEPWAEMPPNITNGGLISNLNDLIETLDQMVALSSDSENARASRDELNNRLNERLEWFQQTAAPLAFNAKIDRRIRDRPSDATEQAADLSGLENAAHELREQQERLRRELESQSEAVIQARAKARDSASEELSEVFRERSDDYSQSANRWLIALCVRGAAVGGWGRSRGSLRPCLRAPVVMPWVLLGSRCADGSCLLLTSCLGNSLLRDGERSEAEGPRRGQARTGQSRAHEGHA
jgi:hypothetical protein